MKLLPILALALIATAVAEPIKFPELETASGKVYKDVTVTEKRADGISIQHAGGTARINHEDLPVSAQKTLGGFDKAKAKEARKADEKAAADNEKAHEDAARNAQGRTEQVTPTPAPTDTKPAAGDGKAPQAKLQDSQKLTAKIVKYERYYIYDRLVEITARAGDKPLVISGSSGERTIPANSKEVYTFWADGNYKVTASEDGKVVDSESARQKQGLTRGTLR